MGKSFISKFKKSKDEPYSQELKLVEQFIQEGNHGEALKNIEILEAKEDLGEINRIKSQILKSLVFIRMEDCEQGLKLSEEAIKGTSEIDNPLLMADAIIARANALLGLGELDGCLDSAEEGELPLKGVDQRKKEDLADKKACLYWLKGMVHRRKGNLDLALECLKNSFSLREELDDRVEPASLLNDIGMIYASKGELDQALKHLHQSLETYKELGAEHSTIRLFNNIGIVHNYRGELDQALEYYQKGLDLIEKSGNQSIAASAALLSNLSLSYIDKGDFGSALDYIRKSLAKYEELGNKFDSKYEIATNQSNLGVIHELKGDLDEALEIYTRCLKYFEELGNDQKVAMIYNNNGNCYQERGELDIALSYYEKSLPLLEKTGNNLDTSITLLNLISTNLQLGNAENSKMSLQKLEEIAGKDDNKIINQIYRMGKALSLKTSSRVIKRAESQQIFQEIVGEEILRQEYTVLAKKNLCELLLQELQSSGSEEVLKEIKMLLKQLLEFAENQNLFSLLAETYLIQSKIALLELDINSARQLLIQGRQIAETKGLQSLAMIISSEFDTLLNQSSELSELADRDLSIAERLEMAELESMVTKIIKKKADIQELQVEEPVIFLILSKSGMSLFSKEFVPEGQLVDQLIGGFLTAINAFSREAFSESGSIEGIKHEEYTLLMTPIETLIGCYAFKGQSYFAHRKLQQFAEAVKSSDVIRDSLAEADFVGKDLSEEAAIKNLVTSTFLSSSEETPQSISYGLFSQKVTAAIKHGIYL